MHPQIKILSLLLVCLIALTSLGITGSSFGIVDKCGVVQTGTKLFYGDYIPYRGDEAWIHTATAVAQFNHNPQFPVINHNSGIDGKNMLVVHMTGVPVHHITALVKPATWGFFILPLRYALAWYWWLPIVLGIASFYLLLQTLFSRQPWMNLFVASGFVFSMHSTAFSFWPAYVTSFLWLFCVCMIHMLRSQKATTQYLWAAGAGTFLSAGVLTLYIPWVVPALTLSLVLILASVYKERLYQNVSRNTLVAIGISLVCCSAFLIPWFISTHEALATIASSSYPGNRLSVGGDWPLWGLMKGWVSLTTFYTGALMWHGQGYNLYPYMFIPLVAIAIRLKLIENATIHLYDKRYLYQEPIYWLLGLIFLTMLYQYIGFPSWLATITLWTRTHGFAVDILIGAAQMLLFAALLKRYTPEIAFPPKVSLGITFLWASLLPLLALRMPWDAGVNITVRIFLATALLAVLSYILLRGRIRMFLLGYIGITLLVTLPFNPLSRAGKAVTSTVPIPVQESLPYGGRTMFLGIPCANHYWASGGKVFNSTNYYTDWSIYNLLYKHLPEAEKYHKYHYMHCDFSNGDSNENISYVYQPDANFIYFNAGKYDFGKLPLDFVLIPASRMQDVSHNPSLHFDRATDSGFARYYVVKTPSVAPDRGMEQHDE